MSYLFADDQRWRMIQDDALAALRALPDGSVDCCVTSPPYYGLRDYGVAGQIGQEPTVNVYVWKLVEVLTEVRRVLAESGTLWLNIGDSYAGSYGAQGRENGKTVSEMSAHQVSAQGRQLSRTGTLAKTPGCKSKDLIGVPWLLAFSLRSAGWYLRQDIIWAKPNPMPESVRDRCTKAHEYVFLLSKSERYYYDADAIAERAVVGDNRSRFDAGKTGQSQGERVQKGARIDDGRRNARSVWHVANTPSSIHHFAMMPRTLAQRCVLAGCPVGGVVLDPFAGSGTTGLAALESGRRFLGVELNPETVAIARQRLADMASATAQTDMLVGDQLDERQSLTHPQAATA